MDQLTINLWGLQATATGVTGIAALTFIAMLLIALRLRR